MPPQFERAGGTAGEFHSRTVPESDAVVVWWFEVERPAIAVGSRQEPSEVLDLARCAAEGIEVVRRRSGGGAVLLVPREILWVDVVVPAGHPLWVDDVSVAMERMGERWVAALDGFVAGRLEVHRGPMVRTPWSEVVCFDGIGPGEVLLDGHKLVGISQRRTRTAARFQCALHTAYDEQHLTRMLTGPHPSGRRAPVAVLRPDVPLAQAVAGLVAALD